MSRISAKLDTLKSQGRKALIPFITAGDPNPDFTVPTLHAMVEAGADIIELGVPFSDPMADGPVIQKASERALAHKTSLRKVLGMVEEFRKQDAETPIVLMGYLNPVESLGYAAFVTAAKKAGVDGVLTVDMPPEESGELISLLNQAEVAPIFLLAPNSTPERIRKMGQLGSGYLYYVSLKGVTGASHLDLGDVERKLEEIRSLTSLPVGVGFGVKNAETAGAVAKLADAVVVGSALVSKIESAGDDTDLARNEITALLRELRAALDA
ncbi:tryptophan synthase subunit alpha [Methylococcus sp. EFPC2]|uniref:tryptophan synthase subunit alpha n=1 Tax=Methylococcus sp. EFPC2 TaxID=2812648 RepID=UPI0019678695|nr:tryptophan synthase subunit alpha [Methylococcus sp. EFPC2]QSA97093.1 tryptophan synthase subunit alpha [Methylococcus sp. EFPC2]